MQTGSLAKKIDTESEVILQKQEEKRKRVMENFADAFWLSASEYVQDLGSQDSTKEEFAKNVLSNFIETVVSSTYANDCLKAITDRMPEKIKGSEAATFISDKIKVVEQEKINTETKGESVFSLSGFLSNLKSVLKRLFQSKNKSVDDPVIVGGTDKLRKDVTTRMVVIDAEEKLIKFEGEKKFDIDGFTKNAWQVITSNESKKNTYIEKIESALKNKDKKSLHDIAIEVYKDDRFKYEINDFENLYRVANDLKKTVNSTYGESREMIR